MSSSIDSMNALPPLMSSQTSSPASAGPRTPALHDPDLITFGLPIQPHQQQIATPMDTSATAGIAWKESSRRPPKRGYSLFAAGEDESLTSTGLTQTHAASVNSNPKRHATGPTLASVAAPLHLHLSVPLTSSLHLSSLDTGSYGGSSNTSSHSEFTHTTSCSPVLSSVSAAAPFVHLLCPDPRAFEDAHAFTQKQHHMHASNIPAPLTAHLLEAMLPIPSATLNSSATVSRSRLQLKCPPTPAPKMCISVGGADLFSNKVLLPLPAEDSHEFKEHSMTDLLPAAPYLSDSDSDSSGGDSMTIDIHALSSFTNSPTYSSSTPFSHSTAQNPSGGIGQGPYLFEREFTHHKLVGSGSFFEVFRVERKPIDVIDAIQIRRQQAEFTAFSQELDAAAAASLAQTTSGGKRRASVITVRKKAKTRVYAIKKSLKAFRSEYDRNCYLRESKVLDYMNRARLHPPITVGSSSTGGSTASSLMPHRNPHIVRSYQTWQENGYFFERLEYCLCNLNELVYIMMETPATVNAADATAATANLLTPPTSSRHLPLDHAASPAPLHSYFHANMLRVFLSVLTQISLALYSLHQHGIVHLDLKPDNILLGRSRLLLSDFGFAKRLDDLRGNYSDGSRAASPVSGFHRRAESDEGIEGDSVYMAPELLNGASRDGRTSTDADDLGGTDSDEDNMVIEETCTEEADLEIEEQRAANAASEAAAATAIPSTSPISSKVDMFSLGLLLFELLSNCELPKSGWLWQRLRSGYVSEYLPTREKGNETIGLEWMGDVIVNLLEPNPEKRMSSSQVLLKVEEKLKEMKWLDDSIIASSDPSSPSHIDHLVFSWTTALPSVLLLPSLHSLNYQSLLLRARELNQMQAQAAGNGGGGATPRASPFPSQRGGRSGASPNMRRQYSSPSPCPSPSFRQALTAKAQTLSATTPITVASPLPLPTLPLPQFHRDAATPATTDTAATAATVGGSIVTPALGSSRVGKLVESSRPMHHRSASVGVMSQHADDSHDAVPSMSINIISVDGSHSSSRPSHTLSAGPSGCSTPSLARRARPSIDCPNGSNGSMTSTYAPGLQHVPSGSLSARPRTNGPRLNSSRSYTQLLTDSPSPPSAPIPSTSIPPLAVSASARPMIVVPSLLNAGARGAHGASFPLSPFKLNSPARKSPTSANTSTTTGSFAFTPGGSSVGRDRQQHALLLSRAHAQSRALSSSDSPPGSTPHYRALFSSANASPTSIVPSTASLPPYSPAHASPVSTSLMGHSGATALSMFAPASARGIFATTTNFHPTIVSSHQPIMTALSLFSPPSSARAMFASSTPGSSVAIGMAEKGSVLSMLSARLNSNSPEPQPTH